MKLESYIAVTHCFVNPKNSGNSLGNSSPHSILDLVSLDYHLFQLMQNSLSSEAFNDVIGQSLTDNFIVLEQDIKIEYENFLNVMS